MSEYRAKRRSKEERADILRGIKRGEDGQPLPGQTKNAARRAGVSAATIRGWVNRDGWPEDGQVDAVAKRTVATALQRTPKSVATHPPAVATQEEKREPVGTLETEVSVAMAELTPQQSAACVALAEGCSLREASRRSGVPLTTLHRLMKRAGPFAEALGRLQAYAAIQMVQSLKAAAVNAGAATAAVLQSYAEIAEATSQEVRRLTLDGKHLEAFASAKALVMLAKDANPTVRTALQAANVIGSDAVQVTVNATDDQKKIDSNPVAELATMMGG